MFLYGCYRSGTVSTLTILGRCSFEMDENRSRCAGHFVRPIKNIESATRGAVGGVRVLWGCRVLTREWGSAEGSHAAGSRNRQRAYGGGARSPGSGCAQVDYQTLCENPRFGSVWFDRCVIGGDWFLRGVRGVTGEGARRRMESRRWLMLHIRE